MKVAGLVPVLASEPSEETLAAGEAERALIRLHSGASRSDSCIALALPP